MSDASVLANAQRQAELEARHRDLTKAVAAPGTDGDSLRTLKGMEQITDEMLDHRAHFDPKAKPAHQIQTIKSDTLNLSTMSCEELLGLADAALTEASRRPETETNG